MSAEIQERLLAIAVELLDRTKKGLVDWSVTDDEEAFLYSGERSGVIVDVLKSKQGLIHVMSLVNERGTVVESLRSAWDQDAWEMKPAPWNATLEELYGAARHSALRVSDVIDDVLRTLRDMPPF